MACRCSVIIGELVIDDPATGRVLWKGKFEGVPAWKALCVPASDDCLVLLEYWTERQHGFQNLLRVRPDGCVLWRAELPNPTDDAYVRIEWNNETLVAGSWSGFRVVLDPDTGQILSKTFVK